MESQTPSAQVFLKAKDIAKFMFVAPVKYPPKCFNLDQTRRQFKYYSPKLNYKVWLKSFIGDGRYSKK